MTLHPAPAGDGIVFRRADLRTDIAARFDHVADARLATTLGIGGARVGTVEHLMAALSGSAIDNVLVEVDGPELPILDGSAAPWLFLIDCAGVVTQREPRRIIEVLRRVRVADGDSWAELAPPDAYDGLELSVSIDFPAAAIGRQSVSLRLAPDDPFRRQVARARTFTLAGDIAALREAGLAQGGSLENAVVVDGGRVLNPGGLRMADEFVCHKLLDAIGDLALAGPLRACFRAHRSGHALHNRLLRALFADRAAWREVTLGEQRVAA